MANEPPRRDNTLETVLTVGLIGGAAYVAYQYWYIPAQIRAKLEEDAMRIRASNPQISKQDALARAAALGCQIYGASYALPPQATAALCSGLGAAASSTLRNLPGLGLTIVKAPIAIARDVGKEVAKPFVSIGKGVGKGAKAIGNWFSKTF